MNRIRFALPALAAVALAALLTAPAPAQSSYTFKDLGSLGGATANSRGHAVNSLGHVVGASHLSAASDRFHAFFWDGSRMIDMAEPAEPEYSLALSINDHDEAVGWAGPFAFVWFPTPRAWNPTLPAAKITNLNALLSDADRLKWELATATGINNNHQVAGWGRYLTSAGTWITHRAFLLDLRTSPATLTDLGSLAGPDGISAAAALNHLSAPFVVGTTYLPDGGNDDYIAKYDPANGSYSMMALGGRRANAVSNAGELVGSISGVGNAYWTQTGLTKALSFWPVSINNPKNGRPTTVVGNAAGSGNIVYRAYRWQVGERSGGTDLNKLAKGRGSWTLMWARGVADSGHIAGEAVNGSYQHAYLLIPN